MQGTSTAGLLTEAIPIPFPIPFPINSIESVRKVIPGMGRGGNSLEVGLNWKTSCPSIHTINAYSMHPEAPTAQHPATSLWGQALLVVLVWCGACISARSAAIPMPSGRPAMAPQVARDGWKDCAFNDVPIGCVDQQLADGFRLVWKDGLRMRYRAQAPQNTRNPVLLRDQLGGVWRREVLAQGNIVMTNVGNGAQIFIPLRFPCKPPLKGEVGYCHE